MDNIELHESAPEDAASILALYPKAFPEEELRPVVRALLDDPETAISIVAEIGGVLAGHVMFTFCTIDDAAPAVALLAPLTIDPAWQKRGVGKALVRHGFQLLNAKGVAHVYVLGDPAYYRRFGFAAETKVAPPYPMPPEWLEAWQSVPLAAQLDDASEPPQQGALTVPAPWRQPTLWGP